MKVVIEDVETGSYITDKITFTKLEPEKVEYERFHEDIDGIIFHIDIVFRRAKSVKEEEVK